MIGQVRVQLEDQQPSIRRHPFHKFTGVTALAGPEFDKNFFLKIDPIKHTPHQSLGTWQHVSHLERTRQKAAEENGTH
jgi:hypothetical protein